MKVRYLYSASVVIDTPDVSILCDPWFTEGAYDGSWYHWPATTWNPIETIGPVNAIWISHLHADHYDPTFLRAYLERYPGTTLLAGESRRLVALMRRDGFSPISRAVIHHGDTTLTSVPNEPWSNDNIDSALVVTHGDQSIVNLNDCGAPEPLMTTIRRLAPNPTALLAPYTGAGPFPQTFLAHFGYQNVCRASIEKAQYFANITAAMFEWLQPIYLLPFAGQYQLGGRNAELDDLRGTVDPMEIAGQFAGGLVLEENGVLDLDAGCADMRTEGFTLDDPHRLVDRPMAWENDPLDPDLGALVEKATARGLEHAPIENPFTLVTEEETFAMPDSIGEIHVPARYLAGLLTRRYHWDNALVGSNLRFDAPTAIISRGNREFLNGFQT